MSETGTHGAAGRLPTAVILRATFALLRENGRAAWPAIAAALLIWPASVALTAAQTPAERAAAGEPAVLAWTLLAAILPALPAAAATRALLGAARPWRLDLGLGAYVAIEAAFALGWDRLFLVSERLDANAEPNGTAVAALTLLAGMVGMVLATLYWQLWPIGRVMGQRAMTPMRSVAQMHGAVLGSIGANFLLAGGVGMLLGGLAMSLAGAIGAAPATTSLILAVALTPAQLLGLTISAAIWRLRNGPRPDPAAAFD